ncbi:MAG: serine/threonine protein kinase [bacterium]|nr:MAG: serine/threonine protein kinase [bacterium]
MLIFLVKECFICGRCFGDHNLECDLDKAALNTTLLGLPLVKNRYRLDRRINTELIGATYLAYDIENKCKTTLKVILMEYLQSDFQKYSKVLEAIAQISHPNLISILDYGKNDEASFYIVMEHTLFMMLVKCTKI